MTVARLRMQACEADIARIDAGPAAIAFTARGDLAGLADRLSLTPKNGRALLAERIDDPDHRLARIGGLIGATR